MQTQQKNSPVYKKVLEFKKKYPSTISWRLRAHSKVVEKYLNPGEEVLYAFAVQKNYSFFDIFNTYVFCLSNKRIIIGRKRILWGSFLTTITPDLYNDMQIYSGLFFGKIVIDTVKELVELSNISKKALDEIETIISEFMMSEKQKYKERTID